MQYTLWVGSLRWRYLAIIASRLKLIARLSYQHTGALGGIVAFLLWIYLSGCFAVLGVCVCAAQYRAQHTAPELAGLVLKANSLIDFLGDK